MRPKNPPPRANRIRLYREAAHLSQAALGELVDLTGSAVSRHENHERALTDEQADAYAKAFKVRTIYW